MVREWQKERDQPTRGFRPHVERWVITDWEQVLGRCAGEDGYLLFDSESIKVTKEEEISFASLFKSSKSSKNGYKIRDYKDRYRRNVAVALLQLLQPHKTTYITSWQRPSGCNFRPGLLSRSNPKGYVKDVEVDTDEDETPACTPPAQPRAEEESLAARVPRKRRWGGEAKKSQQREYAALKRKRPLAELFSRPKQKARRLVLPASSAETRRVAERRNSPSSGEDRSTRTAERSADLPTPKARTPSVEARRPSRQERRHAAPTIVPAGDRCSAQVPFADSPSTQRRKGKEPAEVTPLAQETLSREPSRQEPSAEDPPEGAPSAQGPSAQGTSGEPPSAEAPPAKAPSAEAQCEKEDDEEKG
ncbi:hypothetical protein AXG93_2891s1000 [Marchantia polymorpha subsp. ruderalis]|uniref:Uncharacterized protein n=1 Tax=Marchantia polymorpha subsp. ruderalis TaxID=1480154 RepID=A0A176WLN7_MARPO|nr:hypothetical protein AXG93_2891s1000 [Marchantia polymorpha subsp. ruderalis]